MHSNTKRDSVGAGGAKSGDIKSSSADLIYILEAVIARRLPEKFTSKTKYQVPAYW